MTRFIFPHQTTKAIKKNTKHWIQTLDSRQLETMLSTRTETNEMSEWLPFCLETLNRIPRRENTDRKTPVVSLGWWSLQSDSHSWSVQGRARESQSWTEGKLHRKPTLPPNTMCEWGNSQRQRKEPHRGGHKIMHALPFSQEESVPLSTWGMAKHSEGNYLNCEEKLAWN